MKYHPAEPYWWEDKAECYGEDTEMWFPLVIPAVISEKNTDIFGFQIAASLCEQCPVKKRCAKTVIDSIGTDWQITDGIWAGVRLLGSHRKTETLKDRYAELRRIAGMYDET